MIPNTRYLDAGPSLPQASQSAAQAKGEAMARMGQTISAIGEKGFVIAERVRRAEEASEIAGYFSMIDQRAGKFSNELLRRTDPENWPKEWRADVEDLKSQSRSLKLSPETRGQLDLKLQEWSTTRTIRFEGLAATRTVDEGRAKIDLGLRHAISRGDREEAEQYFSLMPGLGMMPSQIDESRLTAERQFSRQALTEDAATDPIGTLERVSSPDFLDQEGNEHLTLEDVGFAKNEALQAQRTVISNANTRFQDMAAAGEIRTPEDLKATFGNTLPPRVMEAMENDLANRWNAEEQQRRATPEYQAETIGAIEAALIDLPLELDQFPEKLVELESKAYTLPQGPIRTHALERIKNVSEGNMQTFENAADFAREDFKAAYKSNYFGDIESEITTTALIDTGFLRNRNNLTGHGFSPEQTDTIMGTKINKEALHNVGFSDKEVSNIIDAAKNGKLSDAKRTELFRAFSAKRPNSSTLKGYKADTAQAIMLGETKVSRTDKAGLAQANLRLGQVTQEFDKWLKANPTKVEDFDAVQAKKNEILDRFTVSDFNNEFLAPNVLPPNSPSPYVPNFLDQ